MDFASTTTPAPMSSAAPTFATCLMKGKALHEFKQLPPDQWEVPFLVGVSARSAKTLPSTAQVLVGTGRIGYRETFLLTIRVQVNDHQFYWLADPYAEETWAALRAWRKCGWVGVVLTFDPGIATIVKLEAPDIGLIVEHDFRGSPPASVHDVLQAIHALLVSGALVTGATSDIQEFPVLKRVEVFVLVSERMKDFLRTEGTLLSAPAAVVPTGTAVH